MSQWDKLSRCRKHAGRGKSKMGNADLKQRTATWLLIFCATFAALSVSASTSFVWTNTVGGNWSNPSNWSPHGVPGALDTGTNTDDVLITNAGTYSVTFDLGYGPDFEIWQVHSLILGAGTNGGIQTLILANTGLGADSLIATGGGLITASNAIIGTPVTISGNGKLVSAGGSFGDALTIGNGGVFAGTFDNLESMAVASNGLATVSGEYIINGPLTVDGTLDIEMDGLDLDCPATNCGVINIESPYPFDGAEMNVGYPGWFVNQAGGVINLKTAGEAISAPQGKVINRGVIVSSASCSIGASTFDNSAGVITNLSGILALSSFTNTLAGRYYVTNGAAIQFSGGDGLLLPGDPFDLSGGGQYEFVSGYLYYPTNIITNLQITGGILALGPAFQGGTITNLTLNNATLVNMLPVSGTMNVSNCIVYGNWSPLTGTINALNSSIYGNETISDDGLVNAEGAVFHGAITLARGGQLEGGLLTISPDGSLTVNGVYSPGFLVLDGPMTNAGTVNVSTGMIEINNDGSNYLGGLINLTNGMINLDDDEGAIYGTNFGNEYFINEGTLTKDAIWDPFGVNVSDFTNTGAIFVQKGMLPLNNVTLEPSGSLNVCLTSAQDYGKLSICGNAVLAGTFGIQFTNGYVATNGTSFNVLSYPSHSGDFNSLNVPSAVAWLPQYNNTNFTLTARQPKFDGSLSGNGFILEAGGTPGNRVVLLTSTNLALPLFQWTPLSTNTFDSNGYVDFTNAVNPGKRGFFVLKFF